MPAARRHRAAARARRIRARLVARRDAGSRFSRTSTPTSRPVPSARRADRRSGRRCQGWRSDAAHAKRAADGWPCRAGVEPRWPLSRVHRVRRRRGRGHLAAALDSAARRARCRQAASSTSWRSRRRRSLDLTRQAANRSSSACRSIRRPARVRGAREVIACRRRAGRARALDHGDGKRLAFAGLALSSQIWAQPIDDEGRMHGAARALTSDTSRRNSFAAVSPDGAKVAYVSTRNGELPNIW